MGVVPSPFHNIAWKAIYAFHMPLFFFISGIVSVGAVSRNFKQLAVSRFWSLFLPLCIWSAVLYVIKLSIGYSVFKTDGMLSIFKSIAGGIIYEYWFIWALLYSVFLANIVHRICNRTWVLLLSVVLVWLIPETIIPYVHHLKTMYPFFVMGYVYSTHRDKLKFLKNRYLLAMALPVFVMCSIYFSPYTIMFVPERMIDVWNERAHYLYITCFYLFFLTAGFSGICVCYHLMRLIPASGRLYALFQDIGHYTFIIYMLQGLWFFSFCRQYEYHVTYQSLAFVMGIIITYVVYRIGRKMALTRQTAFLAGFKK